MKELKSIRKHTLLITILFQSTIILIYNTSILSATSLDLLKRNVLNYNIYIPIIVVLVIASLKIIEGYEKIQIELSSVKTNIKAMEELLILLRVERHDYISHIQSIQSLLYLEELIELSSYVEGISKQYNMTSQIIRVGHPVLAAILNIKSHEAHEKGIAFYINCKDKVDNIRLNSWELTSVFSNLIGNAIEAAMIDSKSKWVKLVIHHYDNDYIIKIENPGNINSDIIKSLYDPGVSTKNSTRSGYGLYICKKILYKYNGDIKVKNTNTNTVVVTVTLPKGKIGSVK